MSDLHVDPFGGLAGDMFLAALLDLGRPELELRHLQELAERLVPGEARLATREVKRGSLRGLLLEVRTPESDDPPHRHLSDLLALLDEADLPETVRERAARTLRRIAEAEARVHGTEVEAVHFHEVGAVDTLVDVVGAFVALEKLGVERVTSEPPYVGSGTVACAHGEMPVPAPGTLELLRGRALRSGPGGERLTPTGAALLAELVEEGSGTDEAAARVEAIGYGAGGRDPAEGPPNLVRVRLTGPVGDDAAGAPTTEEVLLLELNLDDAPGEEVGFLVERLREAGALEVWTHPVQMKKDRPGVVVSLLAREALRPELEALIFTHSPTLGVRWTRWRRSAAPRETLEVAVRGRRVRVKRRLRPAGSPPSPHDLSPEFDDLARLARELDVPLRTLEEEARAACRELGAGPS